MWRPERGLLNKIMSGLSWYGEVMSVHIAMVRQHIQTRARCTRVLGPIWADVRMSLFAGAHSGIERSDRRRSFYIPEVVLDIGRTRIRKLEGCR